MKKLLNALILCLILILPTFADLKDLTINANNVSYEREKSQIEATGSVEVIYKNITLTGAHLIYNTSSETAFLDHGFCLIYEGMTFEGSVINYQIKKQIGLASQVNFIYDRVSLNGQGLQLDSEQLKLQNASFSTCGLAYPHYKVSAKDVILYPKHGWLVAYWGWFWLGQFPVVPMPTYIYDFQARERARQNLPPFPAVGVNDEDGNYVSETLAWHIRRELSGSYTLGYTSTKGVELGVETNYIIDDQNEGDSRIFWNQKNQFYGGLSHRYSFGPEIEPEKKSGLELFATPHYRKYQLETTISAHERINYQRVSFLPDVILRCHDQKLADSGIKYDYQLESGRIAEDGGSRLLRGGGLIKFYQGFQNVNFGNITPYLWLEPIYYSNGTKWEKSMSGIDAAKSLSNNFFLELGYHHFLFVNGTSPFLYELYRFRAADRLTSGLTFMIGETGTKLSASYFLDNWSPEDVDCTLFFKLHCYNLMVTYRTQRKEFTLGFSLAAGS